MKVIKAYPPNFSTLAKAFPIKGRPGILYAFGDKLYNPSGVKVTPWIMAHEEVHSQRQSIMFGMVELSHDKKAVARDQWWKRYINEPKFRLEEELLAHRAEWQSYTDHNISSGVEKYLDLLSTRLSSPLYGSMISHNDAQRRIIDDRG